MFSNIITPKGLKIAIDHDSGTWVLTGEGKFTCVPVVNLSEFDEILTDVHMLMVMTQPIIVIAGNLQDAYDMALEHLYQEDVPDDSFLSIHDVTRRHYADVITELGSKACSICTIDKLCEEGADCLTIQGLWQATENYTLVDGTNVMIDNDDIGYWLRDPKSLQDVVNEIANYLNLD